MDVILLTLQGRSQRKALHGGRICVYSVELCCDRGRGRRVDAISWYAVVFALATVIVGELDDTQMQRKEDARVCGRECSRLDDDTTIAVFDMDDAMSDYTSLALTRDSTRASVRMMTSPRVVVLLTLTSPPSCLAITSRQVDRSCRTSSSAISSKELDQKSGDEKDDGTRLAVPAVK